MNEWRWTMVGLPLKNRFRHPTLRKQKNANQFLYFHSFVKCEYRLSGSVFYEVWKTDHGNKVVICYMLYYVLMLGTYLNVNVENIFLGHFSRWGWWLLVRWLQAGRSPAIDPGVVLIWNQFTHCCSTALIFLWRCVSGLEMNERKINIWSAEWVDVSWWGASNFLSFCLLYVFLVKMPVWEWMKGKWTYGQDDSSWWGASRQAGLLCPVCPVQNWSLSTKSPLSRVIPRCQIHKHKNMYKYTNTLCQVQNWSLCTWMYLL